MQSQIYRSIAAAILFFVAPACTEADGDDPVPDTRALVELDEGERQALCDESTAALEPHLDDINAGLCVVLIAAFSEDVAACEAQLDACESPGQDFDPDEASCPLLDLSDECDATVDEFRSCSAAFNASYIQIASITCEQAFEQLDDNDPGDDTITIPPECEALERRCPEAFDQLG